MSAAPRASAAEARAEADEILADLVRSTRETAVLPSLDLGYAITEAHRTLAHCAGSILKVDVPPTRYGARRRAGLLIALAEAEGRVRAAWAEAKA